jgi:hypothetical protein
MILTFIRTQMTAVKGASDIIIAVENGFIHIFGLPASREKSVS